MFGRLAPRKVRPGSAKAPLHKRNISRRAQRLDRTKEAASEEEVAAVQLEDVELHEEASKSYLSYALSVIIGRAIPDVRDGLKPVQRRTLHAMRELGLRSDRPFRKSARVVGEVLGKFHPHGDSPVYQSLVRLAQPFSVREPLIDGHGNFGSIDNDPPAAMRYTECRLQGLTEPLLLDDLTKQTVRWQDNFDGSQVEPEVLPARLPNLLLNGSSGIAVGVATQIPSHNLSELADAVALLARKPSAELADVMQVMPAPDLPTGGMIVDQKEVKSIYQKGKGSLTIRGRTHMEKSGQRERIVITEIPFMTDKSNLIQKMADLVTNKKLSGVTAIRDESDRRGMRIVLELRKATDPVAVLSTLSSNTKLENKLSCNMVALRGREPKLMSLMDQLWDFIRFRKEVVKNRARGRPRLLYGSPIESLAQPAISGDASAQGAQKERLENARARAHIIEGLATSLNNLDTVLETIRNAKNNKEAIQSLQDSIQVSEDQADAVMGMSLRKLTGQEHEKLEKEKEELHQEIHQLTALLDSDEDVAKLVGEEAEQLKEQFGSDRITRVLTSKETEELSQSPAAALYGFKETVSSSLLFLNLDGSIKLVEASSFRRRGFNEAFPGRRKHGLARVLPCHGNEKVYLFTSSGKVVHFPADEVPLDRRDGPGRDLSDSFSLEESEDWMACFSAPHSGNSLQSLVLTKEGYLAQIPLSSLSSSNGIAAGVSVKHSDRVETACLADEGSAESIMLVSRKGYMVRCSIDEVPKRKKRAQGVLCLKLGEKDGMVDMDLCGRATEHAIFVSALGNAVRRPLANLPLKSRRSVGWTPMKLEGSDCMACVRAVPDAQDGDLLVITRLGNVARVDWSDVPEKAHNASKGVNVMAVSEGDEVVDVAFISSSDSD